MRLKLTRCILLLTFVPILAQAQAQRKPVVQPVLSAVLSGPSGPLYQLGGGLRYADWSYEIRYGWDLAVTANRGSGTFHPIAVYARQNISNIFYWMTGVVYASYQFHPPVSDPGYYGPALSEHTWHSLTPALALGVGYKYIFLELQAYYPGVLLGIRLGVN